MTDIMYSERLGGGLTINGEPVRYSKVSIQVPSVDGGVTTETIFDAGDELGESPIAGVTATIVISILSRSGPEDSNQNNPNDELVD